MTLLHDQPSTSPSSDSLTSAPTEPWRALIEWARSQNCLAELLLLAYTTHCEHDPEWFGTVLLPLGVPANLALLDRWAAVLPELQPLFVLGNCVAHLDDRAENAIPKPLPPEMPPEVQLRGHLKFAYLLAAHIDSPPQPKDKSRSAELALWFSTVRLWLMGQAIIRAQRDNRLDANIKLVSDALRLAASRKPEWLALVTALYEPLPTSFESLSQALRRKSQESLRRLDSNFGAGQREAMQAFGRIASNEDAPFSISDERRMELPRIFRNEWRAPREAKVSFALLGDEDDGLWTDGSDGLNEPGDDRSAVHDGDESETPKQRTAVGRTIQLHASEAAQFLPWSWHQLT